MYTKKEKYPFKENIVLLNFNQYNQQVLIKVCWLNNKISKLTEKLKSSN